MTEDVPYYFQTKFRIWDRAIIEQMIVKYEQQFEMKAPEYHELFLEGKIKGEDGQRFMFLYEFYVSSY